MTSAAEEQNDAAAQSEPPAKRRRGGRRSSNPEISAEERKRLRVLKNRESAMRSLAKKAEYSAKLEDMEREAIAEYKSSRENLEKLITTAIGLRTALGKVPEDIEKLISEVEESINRGTAALADDHETHVNDAQQTSPDPTADHSANGESADGR